MKKDTDMTLRTVETAGFTTLTSSTALGYTRTFKGGGKLVIKLTPFGVFKGAEAVKADKDLFEEFEDSYDANNKASLFNVGSRQKTDINTFLKLAIEHLDDKTTKNGPKQFKMLVAYTSVDRLIKKIEKLSKDLKNLDKYDPLTDRVPRFISKNEQLIEVLRAFKALDPTTFSTSPSRKAVSFIVKLSVSLFRYTDEGNRARGDIKKSMKGLYRKILLVFDFSSSKINIGETASVKSSVERV